MAPAPNFGVFLDFAHPFLTEVDFSNILKNSLNIKYLNFPNFGSKKLRIPRLKKVKTSSIIWKIPKYDKEFTSEETNSAFSWIPDLPDFFDKRVKLFVQK